MQQLCLSWKQAKRTESVFLNTVEELVQFKKGLEGLLNVSENEKDVQGLLDQLTLQHNDALKVANERYETADKEHESRVEELNSKIEALEKQVETKNRDVSLCETEIHGLKIKVMESNTEIFSLTSKNKTLLDKIDV